MNEYCKHTINRFYDLFVSRQFDQDDIALLFVVARDYFDKGEVVRELGDFIAHPKLKTQGIVFNNIKGKVIPQFDKFLDKYKRGNVDITKLPAIDVLCSDELLIEQLLKIFKLANIAPENISREDDNFREFVFCLVFLLSNYKLLINNDALEMSAIYSHSLVLRVSVESSKKSRTFAQIPVLQVHNVWIDCPTIPMPAEHTLTQHIVRRFDDGCQGYVAAISFNDDQGQKIYKSKDFKRGQCWPLPVRAKYS
jgi:hypothetical protein